MKSHQKTKADVKDIADSLGLRLLRKEIQAEVYIQDKMIYLKGSSGYRDIRYNP